MSNDKLPENMPTINPSIWKRIIYSRPVEFITQIPPIPWISQKLTALTVRLARRMFVREQIESPVDVTEIAQLTSNKEKHPLDVELNLIAHDIVHSLGFAGAMVAAYEHGDALPARAFYVNPLIAPMDKIRDWEDQVRKISPPDSPISLTDPAIARVYVHQDKYKDNLSVRAAKARVPITSNELFDLFTPIAPAIARPFIKGVQEGLGIKQVITVPFFIDTVIKGKPEQEFVGNLFAAKIGQEFTNDDKRILAGFSHHAAAAIQGERRRLQSESNQKLVFDMQRYIANEEQILESIVKGIVEDLGYMGAMVATYELGDALPARAFYVNPLIAPMDKIRDWEDQVRKISPPDSPISLTDPAIARVYVHQDKYKDNLSVRAAKARVPITSNELFDLFTPIAPAIARPFIKGVQEGLGIKQVITIPFFLGDELVGNLFAATQSEKFSNWEIEVLQAFGQNAAAGIRNARIYKHSEDRRLAAQIFGRMAFSAATNVHAFRNHVGLIKMSMDLLISKTDITERSELLDQFMPMIKGRITSITEILESLHTPWQIQHDSDVDINVCITRALHSILPNWESEEWVSFRKKDLPSIQTSQEMLTEAFRILIKNAKEAIAEKGGQGRLAIESDLLADYIVEIRIRDTGVGIKLENFERVFELRWSTKRSGLGFGLFWTKDYIEGLGGRISFESKLDIGTTFIINLPTQKQHS